MGCCTKSNVRIIKIGDLETGLKGLDQVLRNMHRSGLQDENEIQRKLLEWIRESGNYVAPAKEDDYKTALMREYKRFVDDIKHQHRKSG